MAVDRDADVTFLELGSCGSGLEGFHVRMRQSGGLMVGEGGEG